VQENHYMPFGLGMRGLDWVQNAGKENKYQYNGGVEKNTDFDLNWYETFYRNLDVQTGRFVQVDPLAEDGNQENLTPYHYAYNNPIRYNDPKGDIPIPIEAINKLVEGINQIIKRVEWVREMQIKESMFKPIETQKSISPIENPLPITRGFGMKFHPVYKVNKFHAGVDLNPKGKASNLEPIIAPLNGKITYIGVQSGYGNVIQMKDNKNRIHHFAHLNNTGFGTIVKIGDFVGQGQIIGRVGNTGVGTGAHLHYEIRVDGKPVNPEIHNDELKERSENQ
jgi:RHS repeat-associated protein